jgi:hypothetical protein
MEFTCGIDLKDFFASLLYYPGVALQLEAEAAIFRPVPLEALAIPPLVAGKANPAYITEDNTRL